MQNNNKKTKTLIIGEPLIDWYTVTAWQDGVTNSWAYWDKVARDNQLEKSDEAKVMQYDGHYWVGGDGSYFLGTGQQKNQIHNMVRCSGNLSHSTFDRAVGKPVSNGWGKCTRLDIQITIPEHDEYSAWELANALREKGHNVGYIDSASGKGGSKLATIYIGSRNSSRMTRIYQKEGGSKSERFLRFETEFKGHRANIMAKSIAENRVEMCNYLAHEAQQLNSKLIDFYFAEHLYHYDPKSVKVRRVKATDSTAHWLLTKCLPALDKHVNSHDNDDEVLMAFWKTLLDRTHWL